jgi:hypothetical protein
VFSLSLIGNHFQHIFYREDANPNGRIFYREDATPNGRICRYWVVALWFRDHSDHATKACAMCVSRSRPLFANQGINRFFPLYLRIIHAHHDRHHCYQKLLLLVLLTIVIFQLRHRHGAHSQHASHRFHQNICRGTRTQALVSALSGNCY